MADHDHNAHLYSRMMLSLEPEAQGFLEALGRDLAHLPLAAASEAVDRGLVLDAATGRPVRWEGSEQVSRLSRA